MTQQNIDEAQIRETAYLLWLDDGQPEGRDQEHWLKAIDALTPAKPKRKAPAKPRATKAKAATKTTAAPKTKAKAAPAAKKPRATKAAKPAAS